MRERRNQRRTVPDRRVLADRRTVERPRLAPLVQRRSGQGRRTRHRRRAVERRVLPDWSGVSKVPVTDALPLPRAPRSIPWNSILYLATWIIVLYLLWKAMTSIR